MIILLCSVGLNAQGTKQPFPFSTNEDHLTIWNGEKYVSIFLKGVNIGAAIPGTFPGELAPNRATYASWLRQIRDAGFNVIRLYTLHFPRFYEELVKFNEANPNTPIYFIQGVWLEEELEGYNQDLHFLRDSFRHEIRTNINAVHGNITIPQRQGKAYGNYNEDASKWLMAYIIGREIHPPEVIKTNETHADEVSYFGEYLSIERTRPTEVWMVQHFDYLLSYELDKYGVQHPVSASSWPTLDPLIHPLEENEYEDSAFLDFSNVDASKAKAGFFISYHAYSYYPNFISRAPEYMMFSDYKGQNSYLGYLTYLKDHYQNFPLIIAEYGGSSSWGIAHFAHNGIHHGGYSEKEKGEHNIRLLRNIQEAGAGGGIQFAWIDEWFKRTWITDRVDEDVERRILWHNVTAAEQNFGLLGFKSNNEGMFRWQTIDDDLVTSIDVSTDFAYLKLKLNMNEVLAESDSVWIGIDTYDSDLGESVLPNGQTVTNRVEFALLVTNYEAELYVTEAYDLFGIWHRTSNAEQKYQSTITDGAPWKLVRWKNDTFDREAQDIGSLVLNRLNLPRTSKDAVRLEEDGVYIRLPWTLLNFTDPTRGEVMHDDRSTSDVQEKRISQGVSLSISYRNLFVETVNRYRWENWNHALNAVEYQKNSYHVIKAELPKIGGTPIAVKDKYTVAVDSVLDTPAERGVLANDLALDGGDMRIRLLEPTVHGNISIESDGSFSYSPDAGYTGKDQFRYITSVNGFESEPGIVEITVTGQAQGKGFISIYPNPSSGSFTISSPAIIDQVVIYDLTGRLIAKREIKAKNYRFKLNVAPGIYLITIQSGYDIEHRKFTVIR